MAQADPNISVRIVCGADELKVIGSYYLKEPIGDRRIISTDNLDDTLDRFLRRYSGTTTQFSITPGDPSKGLPLVQWIITPRGGQLAKQTDVKGYSKSTDPTYLTTIRREFQEETGSDIPEAYFHQDPADPFKFCLNIHPDGKAILDKNYEAIKPATETWGWKWVPSAGPCAGTVVPASDITQTPITTAVVAAKARLIAADAARADESAAERKRVTDSMKRSTGPYSGPEYSAVNAGETLADYVKRVGKDYQPRDLINIRKYGESIGLKGGRRTIRRKKSKQPKRKGTSKKGVRRSH
jgi:hypothetical protein